MYHFRITDHSLLLISWEICLIIRLIYLNVKIFWYHLLGILPSQLSCTWDPALHLTKGNIYPSLLPSSINLFLFLLRCIDSMKRNEELNVKYNSDLTKKPGQNFKRQCQNIRPKFSFLPRSRK